MDNLDIIREQNFFIITSDDLKIPKHSFYGYAILEDEILISANPSGRKLDSMTPGGWISIDENEDEIIIQQDYFCSYGIFIVKP